MNVNSVKVGIIGVAGYAGGELARLLGVHPNAQLAYVSSNSGAGMPLADVLPGFRGFGDLVCEAPDLTRAIDLCDILFAAQEGGWASENAAEILATGKKLIDISADFRLCDPDTYRQWYKMEPAADEVQGQAVYGLPEINRERIRGASLIANPGCFPTSVILALMPAIKHKLIDERSIIINSMSGVSGAGRSKHNLTYHFPELNESASAYGVGGTHRHTPEIEQVLSDIAQHFVQVSFTPHLIPITRGILTTVVAPIAAGVDASKICGVYAEAYANEPFVHMMPPGKFPATKHTQGTNNVLIGLAADSRMNLLTIVSAEDNLVKGAAGQAIQNMNIMCGFDETAGLTMPGMWP